LAIAIPFQPEFFSVFQEPEYQPGPVCTRQSFLNRLARIIHKFLKNADNYLINQWVVEKAP
jgi:hypothetical protein